MKNPLPKAIRKERNAILRKIFAKMNADYRKKFIGHTMSVLWESCLGKSEAGWEISGLTENYLRVHAITPKPRWNQLDQGSFK